MKSGFSLIETIVAFMLLSIMGGAAAFILVQVQSVTNSAALKSQANAVAMAGLEQVRDYYQKNLWLAVSEKDNTGIKTCYKNANFDTPVNCNTELEDVY